jgi:hypothetical protein
MSTIVTINAGDQITNSRADLNTNFANLNADKIETSVIDTDTALTANSDAKIPSQKAVKAYADSLITINASETVKGSVEEATDAEVTAGTATGATGAKLFVTPAKLYTRRTRTNGGATTRDISLTTTLTFAHGFGIAPTYVRIVMGYYLAGPNLSYTESIYVNSTQSSFYIATEGAAGNANGNAFRIYEDVSSPRYNEGTITVDATNISITWSKTGTPTGTVPILWHAYV